ncbi:MAG: YceH family protein [Zoogloea sp.]|uniref:YceH family protein n=1 Tax=Zoogloea sp. TaxID=49181 RepID=UPI002609D338|nr:YceH family protein [Zoogloea sp.]MDD2989699.1 YceH family protein [Zoogloea sp.]
MTDTVPDVPAAAPETRSGFDLDDFEVRVLAVLIEKSFVTPDTYPLSVNALVTGCNQLTGREPVMSLSEATVLATLDRLVERGLVTQRHQAGARVAKWEHQIRLRHSLTPPMQAVLTILMLRGAQTVGEIRARCERMHTFTSTADVEGVLERLNDKGMAIQLPKAPGTKEARYTHLMSGEAAAQQSFETGESSAPRGGRVGELEEEVRRLRQQLEWLTNEFEEFRKQFQ